MLLPLCHASHFYGLVAVLDEDQPLLVILESLGGSFAKEPPITKIFIEFLAEQRQLLDGRRVEFKIVTPEVPRQAPGSNNCGLFLIKYMRKIIETPEDFVEKVKNCKLADWFPPK